MGGATQYFFRIAGLAAMLWTGIVTAAEEPAPKSLLEKLPGVSSLVSVVEFKDGKVGGGRKKVYCLSAMHWQLNEQAQFGIGVPSGTKDKANVMAALSIKF